MCPKKYRCQAVSKLLKKTCKLKNLKELKNLLNYRKQKLALIKIQLINLRSMALIIQIYCMLLFLASLSLSKYFVSFISFRILKFIYCIIQIYCMSLFLSSFNCSFLAHFDELYPKCLILSLFLFFLQSCRQKYLLLSARNIFGSN